MQTVSVGIVTYNNEDKIENVLNSIFKHTRGVDVTVYVVDNSSSDQTVHVVQTKFPKVKLLSMSSNMGFGEAHNQLLSVLGSDYHVILNPDITFETDVLAELSRYLEKHSDVSMVTPRILFPDGQEQHLPKRNPTLRYVLGGRIGFKSLRRKYTMADVVFTEPAKIEFCTGCFMMLRTSLFCELKGFDNRFFMYFEDADLTRRARKKGHAIFYPGVSVTHVWERASAKSFKFMRIHISSMIKYFMKWKWKKDTSI